MKKLILTFVMTLIGVVAYSQNLVYVETYIKANGTIVEGHYRTEANYTVTDNWSTKGNINPMTGAKGTKNITDYNSTYTDYNRNYSNFNNDILPTISYQINNYMQTNPINYTNDLMKTNSINYTNDLFKTNSLFR